MYPQYLFLKIPITVMKKTALALLLLLTGFNVHATNGPGVTLDQAVQQVQQQTNNGRILSAETVQHNGKRIHRIKVLTDQHKVRVVEIDAEEK